mmetsp:Transcript_73327/g.207804  ORF Transcript_73327/g.207804 Transcript_73327/m.207804 type:complete len:208 (-) Transcript_73327:31-654(-)
MGRGNRKQRFPGIFLALEDGSARHGALRRALVVLGEHREGGLEVLDGLDAVQLAAVELLLLLLAQGRGLRQRLLVRGRFALQLLDAGLQPRAPGGEALDAGLEIGDLCLRGRDRVRLLPLVVAAPALQLVVECLVLIHLLAQRLLHLLQEVHDARHRRVLRPCGRARLQQRARRIGDPVAASRRRCHYKGCCREAEGQQAGHLHSST